MCLLLHPCYLYFSVPCFIDWVTLKECVGEWMSHTKQCLWTLYWVLWTWSLCLFVCFHRLRLVCFLPEFFSVPLHVIHFTSCEVHRPDPSSSCLSLETSLISVLSFLRTVYVFGYDDNIFSSWSKRSSFPFILFRCIHFSPSFFPVLLLLLFFCLLFFFFFLDSHVSCLVRERNRRIKEHFLYFASSPSSLSSCFSLLSPLFAFAKNTNTFFNIHVEEGNDIG